MSGNNSTFQLGRCTLCHSTEVKVRYIDLYTVGSEGTRVCHSCELHLVAVARRLIRYHGNKRMQEALARRKSEEEEQKCLLLRSK